MEHDKYDGYGAFDYGTYDPCHFLDSVLDHMRLEDDAALASVMNVAPTAVDDIRHRRKPVEAAMIVRIHELTGLDVDWLRNALGDRRKSWRLEEDGG